MPRRWGLVWYTPVGREVLIYLFRMMLIILSFSRVGAPVGIYASSSSPWAGSTGFPSCREVGSESSRYLSFSIFCLLVVCLLLFDRMRCDWLSFDFFSAIAEQSQGWKIVDKWKMCRILDKKNTNWLSSSQLVFLWVYSWRVEPRSKKPELGEIVYFLNG